ncbi:hypothetical protein IGI04_025610, partial [Brassica rapa subsp. trilocularis]
KTSRAKAHSYTTDTKFNDGQSCKQCKKVIVYCCPYGCRATSLKRPTEPELIHVPHTPNLRMDSLARSARKQSSIVVYMDAELLIWFT